MIGDADLFRGGLRRGVFLTGSSVGFSSAPAGCTDDCAARARKSQGMELWTAGPR